MFGEATDCTDAVIREDRSRTRSALIVEPVEPGLRLTCICWPTKRSVGEVSGANENPPVLIGAMSEWAKSTSNTVGSDVENCSVAGSPTFNQVTAADSASATIVNCCDPRFVPVIMPSTSVSLLSASSNTTLRATIVPSG